MSEEEANRRVDLFKRVRLCVHSLTTGQSDYSDLQKETAQKFLYGFLLEVTNSLPDESVSRLQGHEEKLRNDRAKQAFPEA